MYISVVFVYTYYNMIKHKYCNNYYYYKAIMLLYEKNN